MEVFGPGTAEPERGFVDRQLVAPLSVLGWSTSPFDPRQMVMSFTGAGLRDIVQNLTEQARKPSRRGIVPIPFRGSPAVGDTSAEAVAGRSGIRWSQQAMKIQGSEEL